MRIWPQIIQTYSFTDALNPGIYIKFLDIQQISADSVICKCRYCAGQGVITLVASSGDGFSSLATDIIIIIIIITYLT